MPDFIDKAIEGDGLRWIYSILWVVDFSALFKSVSGATQVNRTREDVKLAESNVKTFIHWTKKKKKRFV